jgi:hypothetical protein
MEDNEVTVLLKEITELKASIVKLPNMKCAQLQKRQNAAPTCDAKNSHVTCLEQKTTHFIFQCSSE